MKFTTNKSNKSKHITKKNLYDEISEDEYLKSSIQKIEKNISESVKIFKKKKFENEKKIYNTELINKKKQMEQIRETERKIMEWFYINDINPSQRDLYNTLTTVIQSSFRGWIYRKHSTNFKTKKDTLAQNKNKTEIVKKIFLKKNKEDKYILHIFFLKYKIQIERITKKEQNEKIFCNDKVIHNINMIKINYIRMIIKKVLMRYYFLFFNKILRIKNGKDFTSSNDLLLEADKFNKNEIINNNKECIYNNNLN